MDPKIFNCTELAKLYSQGYLKPVMDKLSDVMNMKTHLSSGNDACVFRHGDNQVLKLCTTDIRYFKNYSRGSGTKAQKFKRHINSLSLFLVPVEDILYEEEPLRIFVRMLFYKKEEIVHLLMKVFEYLMMYLVINKYFRSSCHGIREATFQSI